MSAASLSQWFSWAAVTLTVLAALSSAAALYYNTILSHQKDAQIEKLQAGHWKPLTTQESALLLSRILSIQPRSIYIICDGIECLELARTFVDVFKQANWFTQSGPGGLLGIASGIAISPSDETGRSLKEAIESSTKLHVQLIQTSEPKAGPTQLIIGTKPL